MPSTDEIGDFPNDVLQSEITIVSTQRCLMKIWRATFIHNILTMRFYILFENLMESESFHLLEGKLLEWNIFKENSILQQVK